MTLAEQENLDAQARQRRIQRESIQGRIASSVRALDQLAGEMAEKEAALDQLRKLESATGKLPVQIAGKRGVIASGGFGAATIACARTELLSVIAGTIGAQEARLTTLGERRQAEERNLTSLREGIKEFQEQAA